MFEDLEDGLVGAKKSDILEIYFDVPKWPSLSWSDLFLYNFLQFHSRSSLFRLPKDTRNFENTEIFSELSNCDMKVLRKISGK